MIRLKEFYCTDLREPVKTLLAKAVANETNATFIKIVASEFVKKYIGEGARLVREVFELAKEKSTSYYFH